MSDTHIPVAAKHLWPQVYEAFRGVDLIMHGGDLMVTDVLDWLEEIAPYIAIAASTANLLSSTNTHMLTPDHTLAARFMATHTRPQH